MDGSSSLTQ